MRWDIFSWLRTSDALVPSILLTAILQSCCRLKGLSVNNKCFNKTIRPQKQKKEQERKNLNVFAVSQTQRRTLLS